MSEQSRMFGAELRRRRTEASLSLAEFARLLHYSKGYLSKIEQGVRLPSVDLARRCDAVLVAEGQLAGLLPMASSGGVEAATDIQYTDEVWVMSFDPDGQSTFAPVNRRDALITGMTSLLGLAVASPRASTAARQEATVTAFEKLFEQYRQLGQVMSPGVVLPPLVAQTNAARTCALAATGPIQRRLFALTARYAEYTGWMAQESGNDRAAEWWTGLAVRLAAAGGDPHLAAHAQVRRALIALYQHDATQTVELAREAQVDPAVPVRTRMLAAQREAQGHALAGRDLECRQALDRAADLLSAAVESGYPVLGSAYLPDPIAVTTGWCLYDLGDVDGSAEVLGRALGSIPATAHRNHARYGARFALAVAGGGEIEQACVLAHRALDHAELVDSATVRVDLRRLAHVLSRWRTHVSVRELSPRLTAILHVHGR